MNIIKLIDINRRKKFNSIKKILSSKKDKYTIKINDNKLNILLKNKKIITSDYNFYGIMKDNNIWIWGSSIPGTNKEDIKKIKKIKSFSHLFENNNNERYLFYNMFLTQDIIYITDLKQKDWINYLLIYLDNSLYFLNPVNSKNNVQFFTMNKIYQKYI